jgi:hypothetical protein
MFGRVGPGYPAGRPVRAADPLPLTGHPPAAARAPRIPLRLERVSQSAPLVAALASCLVEPGPVPVPGVAMVSLLLADGMGPLYREACRDDLGASSNRRHRRSDASAVGAELQERAECMPGIIGI